MVVSTKVLTPHPNVRQGYNDPYEVTKPLNITSTKVIMGNPLVQPTIAARGAERLFDGGSVVAERLLRVARPLDVHMPTLLSVDLFGPLFMFLVPLDHFIHKLGPG
jgi:hypothetical protein